MNDETGPEMDDAFAARMRRGLAAMAPREVARTRRIRRRIAGGAVGALAIAAVTVLGVQVVGAGGGGGVEAVPTPTPTPSVAATPEPSVAPTPEPSVPETPAPDPEPTPPPGFEGVAAGVPVVTETYDTSEPRGDAGAAFGDAFVVHDVYVLCRGQGSVTLAYEEVDCAQEAPSTVVALLGIVTLESEGSAPAVTLSGDFTGTLRVVRAGEVPGGIGVSGVASVVVPCSSVTSVGGVPFTCTWRQGVLAASEEAAWGIPYSADELVPPVLRTDADVPGTSVVLRFVLDSSR